MEETHFKNRYGMVIDLDKCTGCGACMVACCQENNLPVMPDESDKVRSVTWLRLYRIDNGKPWPKTEYSYFPRPCMHCDHHTPCVSVCPATATKKDENGGFVSQIYTRCIGCRYCMASCPYHARYFNWWDVTWPGALTSALSPDVSPRMRGVVEKCTFCHHRMMKAKDKAAMEGRDELAEGEWTPACVEACPAKAMYFGDLNNAESVVAQLSKGPNAFRLLERLGTQPKVYYLSTREWVRWLSDNHYPGETKVTPMRNLVNG
jgi:Fe-S-cluster-containing dehydrogenase component